MADSNKKYKYRGFNYYKEPGTVLHPGHVLICPKGREIDPGWPESFAPTPEHFRWYIDRYIEAVEHMERLDSQMRSKHGPE